VKDWTIEIDPGADIAIDMAYRQGCSCRGGCSGAVSCKCTGDGLKAIRAGAFGAGFDYREDGEKLFKLLGLMAKQNVSGTRN
jgi:hypothetical protein